MSIYCFKLLKGFVTGGIDRAIGTRAKLLADCSEIKFVFTELPNYEYTKMYMEYGLTDKNMISTYQYLTGHSTVGYQCKVADKISELEKNSFCDRYVKNANEIVLFKNNNIVAKLELLDDDDEIYYGIYFFNRGFLIRFEYYTDSLFYAIHYSPESQPGVGVYAKEYRVVVYDTNGKEKFDLYPPFSPDSFFYPEGKTEIILEFVKALKLTEDDIVIIDQPFLQTYISVLTSDACKAKIYVVLHSGHYFEKYESRDHIYWNNEYYECIRHIDRIDRFIVSSQWQAVDLERQLSMKGYRVPKISVIPAGAVFEYKRPENKRKMFSIFTMSRLEPGKRVDLIIKAVCKAHEVEPNINLYIYGSGSHEYEEELKGLVSYNKAESYISFMGRQNVDDVPQKYEVYISTSLMETFGLSMLEAVSSGNAMIVLNSRYGCNLFVEDKRNGFLIDYDINELQFNEENIVVELANRINEIFKSREQLIEFQNYSYEIAKHYDKKVVKELWEEILL